MRIFQSSLSYRTFELIAECTPEIKVNLLRSFGLDDSQTFRILDDFKDNIDKIILDSGVWSKNQNPDKVKHEVADYGDFLEKHADKFDLYFNYDEDFKELERDNFSGRNENNQKYLESRGLKPVPVLHRLDDNEVKLYTEQVEKYPYVAIGSNAISDDKFRPAVKKLYDAGTKVHAFKIGSADKLKGLHCWSSDCSSHAQWTKGGRCVFFDSSQQKDACISFRPFDKYSNINKDFYHRHPKIDEFRWFIEEFVGIEFEELIKDLNYRTFCNSVYFWWLERYITQENLNNGIYFINDPSDYAAVKSFI